MSRISVKQLVAEFLNSKDEGSDRFRRLYRMATLKGVRLFNMDIQGRFKTVLIYVNANHTVPFPDDYLDYATIAITNQHGEIVPLKRNENLAHVVQGYLTQLQQVVPVPKLPAAIEFIDTPGFPFFWLNYCWGGEWMHLYGEAGGRPTVGRFDVDDEARCFLINPEFKYDSILVTYLTNGYDCDCKGFTIHTFAAEAFDQWLRWQDIVDQRKKATRADVEYERLRFGAEKKKAKLRLNQAHVNEMQDILREHVKLTARG